MEFEADVLIVGAGATGLAALHAIESTLFFAGEATNTEGHHGTVHGAIASGLRAAAEIRQDLQDLQQDLQGSD